MLTCRDLLIRIATCCLKPHAALERCVLDICLVQCRSGRSCVLGQRTTLTRAPTVYACPSPAALLSQACGPPQLKPQARQAAGWPRRPRLMRTSSSSVFRYPCPPSGIAANDLMDMRRRLDEQVMFISLPCVLEGSGTLGFDSPSRQG